MSTYAAGWHETGEPRLVGGLQLAPQSLRLDGRDGSRSLLYADVRDLTEFRPNGRRVLVLKLRDGKRIEIDSLDAAGSLREVADGVRRATQR